jgi:hypothetical protein
MILCYIQRVDKDKNKKQQTGEKMKNYTAYTGTFVTKRGNTREMTFIRESDVPSSVFSGGQKRKLAEGMEAVYDVQAKGWRTFNSNTQIGQLSQKTIQFSFDN